MIPNKWKRDAATGCLVWTGAKVKRGYGYFIRNKRKVYVHRAVWEEANGPIPDGLEVKHSCDNPPCGEPAHLSVGTHAQNMAEAGERGLLTRVTCPAGHGREHRTADGHCRACRRGGQPQAQ